MITLLKVVKQQVSKVFWVCEVLHIYFCIFEIKKIQILHLTGLCAEEIHLCGESAAIDLVTELMYTTGEDVEVLNYMACSQGGSKQPEYPGSGFIGPR